MADQTALSGYSMVLTAVHTDDTTTSGARVSVSVTDDLKARTEPNLPDDWTDLDRRAVDTIRVLAAEAVQNVGNGHPGTAWSCRTSRRCARGAPRRRGIPSTATRPVWRSPPARSARASRQRSGWRWPPGASGGCSIPTPSR